MLEDPKNVLGRVLSIYNALLKRFPLVTAGKHSSQTQLSSSDHGSAEVTGQTWRAGTTGQTGEWNISHYKCAWSVT